MTISTGLTRMNPTKKVPPAAGRRQKEIDKKNPSVIRGTALDLRGMFVILPSRGKNRPLVQSSAGGRRTRGMKRME